MNRARHSANQTNLQPIAQLLASGRLDLAEQQLRTLLRKAPLNAEASCLLGDVLFSRKQFPAAAEAYQRALSLRVSAEALRGLGGVAETLRQFDAAADCYRHWQRLDPKAAEAGYRLAAVLSQQPGKTAEVIDLLTATIAKGWREKESYLMIAHLAHKVLKNFDMAYNACHKVLEIDPQSVDAMLALASLYVATNHTREATDLLQQAMQIDSKRGDLYTLFANSLLKVGRHEDCMQFLQQAVQQAPDDCDVYSQYLYSSNYSEAWSADESFARHLHFNQLVDARATPPARYANSPDPTRKLRIGFISADLREHSVAYFFQPLLQQLDRSQFEVYCYSNNRKRDAVTDELQRLSDGWREVAALTDAELAEQIRSDAIDLLFDLSNHSADNRLPLFAWRPAPLQFSWLGYAATTGLRSIDYIVSDRYLTPDAASARHCSEQPLLLQTYRAFMPSAAMDLPVTPLPALANGYLTFGSFNSFIKISASVLELWAELLQRLPDARLILIVQGAESLDYVREFFAERGIDSARLRLFSKLPLTRFLELHQQVDIALDTFPFAGMTTSIHGLWMGVPMLTLAGTGMLSRAGLSLLAPLELADDFVAGSRAQYVDKAVYWATHIAQLAEIRQQLRPRLQRSPLMDGAAFANDLATQLRACWQRWCAAQSGVASQINQP